MMIIMILSIDNNDDYIDHSDCYDNDDDDV